MANGCMYSYVSTSYIPFFPGRPPPGDCPPSTDLTNNTLSLLPLHPALNNQNVSANAPCRAAPDSDLARAFILLPTRQRECPPCPGPDTMPWWTWTTRCACPREDGCRGLRRWRSTTPADPASCLCLRATSDTRISRKTSNSTTQTSTSRRRAAARVVRRPASRRP